MMTISLLGSPGAQNLGYVVWDSRKGGWVQATESQKASLEKKIEQITPGRSLRQARSDAALAKARSDKQKRAAAIHAWNVKYDPRYQQKAQPKIKVKETLDQAIKSQTVSSVITSLLQFIGVPVGVPGKVRSDAYDKMMSKAGYDIQRNTKKPSGVTYRAVQSRARSFAKRELNRRGIRRGSRNQPVFVPDAGAAGSPAIATQAQPRLQTPQAPRAPQAPQAPQAPSAPSKKLLIRQQRQWRRSSPRKKAQWAMEYAGMVAGIKRGIITRAQADTILTLARAWLESLVDQPVVYSDRNYISVLAEAAKRLIYPNLRLARYRLEKPQPGPQPQPQPGPWP